MRLPIHSVRKRDSKGKLIEVFDCSGQQSVVDFSEQFYEFSYDFPVAVDATDSSGSNDERTEMADSAVDADNIIDLVYDQFGNRL